MKPKTLNDFHTGKHEWGEGGHIDDCVACERNEMINELKAEAIKWVKEEIEVYGRKETESLKRWMKRLDISEEDLK